MSKVGSISTDSQSSMTRYPLVLGNTEFGEKQEGALLNFGVFIYQRFLELTRSMKALAIPLLGMCLDKTLIQKDTGTLTVTAALFTTSTEGFLLILFLRRRYLQWFLLFDSLPSWTKIDKKVLLDSEIDVHSLPWSPLLGVPPFFYPEHLEDQALCEAGQHRKEGRAWRDILSNAPLWGLAGGPGLH